jgi:hypothetical protein
LRINRSYAIAAPLLVQFRSIYHAIAAGLTSRNRRQDLPSPHGCAQVAWAVALEG